jgi:prophage antirepressor-like protein
MENPITVFYFNDKQVRNYTLDGQPWWIAADVCEILEIQNSRDAMSRLDSDERSTVDSTDGAGGPARNIINESGLYSLILGSRKPEAKEFKRWVTHTVLPSIRKTGSYGVANTEFQAMQKTVSSLVANQMQLSQNQKQISDMLSSLIPALQPTRLETIRAKQECRAIRKKRTVHKYGYSKVTRVLNDDLPRIKRLVREYGEQGHDYYACDVISLALDALEATQA